jgi:Ni,Fe-hydrogenase III small subunit
MSPITVNVGVDPPTKHTIVAAEYCVLKSGIDGVCPVDVTVTPVPPETETCPVLVC